MAVRAQILRHRKAKKTPSNSIVVPPYPQVVSTLVLPQAAEKKDCKRFHTAFCHKLSTLGGTNTANRFLGSSVLRTASDRKDRFIWNSPMNARRHNDG
jgi:hypothetical protein